MRRQRAIPVLSGLEMRSNDQNGHSLTGYIARFDSDSHPIGGKYVESIAPGAFQRSLQAPPHGRQTLVVDHDDARIIGATNDTRGTRFVEDTQGLWVDAPNLPDTTQVRDLRELGDAGLLSGMSFEFVPTAKGMQTLEGGKRRRLSDVILYHGTVLTGKQPAYGATTVEVRALGGITGMDPDRLGAVLDAVHDGRRLDRDEFRTLAAVASSLAPTDLRSSVAADAAGEAAFHLSCLLDILGDEAPGTAAARLIKDAIATLQKYVTAKVEAVGSPEDIAATQAERLQDQQEQDPMAGMSDMADRSGTPYLDAARALIAR